MGHPPGSVPDANDEPARLGALRVLDLLDVAPDAALERTARLAARFTRAAMASVMLVEGDRERTVAAHGLVLPPASRPGSFAATAILTPSEVLVVGDAAADQRFSSHALVVGPPFVRFFAGAPVILDDGQAVGCLCVFDVEPRAGLAREEREALQDLAAVAVDGIELRVRQRELRTARAEAKTLSTTDPLTGLSNRRTLDDRLDGAVALARRTGHALAVLMVDVDGFAELNDRLGRDVGDAVLVELAERLASGVREHDLVARIGGDEFVVVLQAVDRAAVAEAAGRIHEALAEAVDMQGADGASRPEAARMSVSIGVALHPADGEDMASLLRAADLAMYEVKAAGGGVRRYGGG